MCAEVINETGNRYGRLLVVGRAANYRNGHAKWRCICDCGSQTNADGYMLRKGLWISCGCWRREQTSRSPKFDRKTHGHSTNGRMTRTYQSWASMIQRCENHNATGFHRWGGRGISVCQRWRSSFENFLADMGLRPRAMSLHRIDNNGDYEPMNCYWETAVTQAPVGERSGKAKLTEDAVRDIRKKLEPVMTQARKYGVSKRTIIQARNRHSWKHVK